MRFRDQRLAQCRHRLPLIGTTWRNLMRAIFAFVGLSLWTATSFAAPTSGQLMYLGVWPHTVLVMDSVQGKIVDKIDLPTDIVRTLVLSPDNKILYASTLKDNS